MGQFSDIDTRLSEIETKIQEIKISLDRLEKLIIVDFTKWFNQIEGTFIRRENLDN